MENIETQLKHLFTELNHRIEEMNTKRRSEGLMGFPGARVQLLGQISLLTNGEVSTILSLAQTGDLDAFLAMENPVKIEFKKLLTSWGFFYDEDSYLIWIPKEAQFSTLFNFANVVVEVIDPESALVSKAVKAPLKNKQLIREAIATEKFPMLVERILKNGGKLEDFV